MIVCRVECDHVQRHPTVEVCEEYVCSINGSTTEALETAKKLGWTDLGNLRHRCPKHSK